MKEYKVVSDARCKGCERFVESDDCCEGCSLYVYHSARDTIFTAIYNDLLAVPENERDEMTTEVLRIMDMAERAARREIPVSEYVLALEKGTLQSIQMCVYTDKEIRTFQLIEFPAVFAAKNVPLAIRVFVQDRELALDLTLLENDIRFGVIPSEPFLKHWQIWERQHLKENVHDELKRLKKVNRYYQRRDPLAEQLYNAFMLASYKPEELF